MLTILLLASLACSQEPLPYADTQLRFEVTASREVLPAAQRGRLFVVLSSHKGRDLRHSIGATGMDAPPLLGIDAILGPDQKAVVDQKALIFPISHLSRLPKGEYQVQAVFAINPDLNDPSAPGNLYSEPRTVALDPRMGGAISLALIHKVPEEKLPPESALLKYIKLKSELLSKFHGRPFYLRAGLILPRDFDKEKDRKYPLLVRIGGYGTRFTAVEGLMRAGSPLRNQWLADDCPRMLLLHLDGAGPYGDPYQVNSANNGPYGDAITQELIPFVEKHYRGIGAGHARVLEGASTGGWVSLALQIFYPDFFNGTWSHCPDPVDFRAFELINIYEDDNAYVNRYQFERPAARQPNGDVVYTVRHECLRERVLGRGNRWELSGKDWGAWNTTFGPRGPDGLPRPLWDGASGKIDKSVLEHWKQYDLRLHLEKNWAILGPKLQNKIHIWVGDGDDYFLNNAVHLLDSFLRRANPPYLGSINYGPGEGHSWQGISPRQMMEDMAAAIARGKAPKE